MKDLVIDGLILTGIGLVVIALCIWVLVAIGSGINEKETSDED